MEINIKTWACAEFGDPQNPPKSTHRPKKIILAAVWPSDEMLRGFERRLALENNPGPTSIPGSVPSDTRYWDCDCSIIFLSAIHEGNADATHATLPSSLEMSKLGPEVRPAFRPTSRTRWCQPHHRSPEEGTPTAPARPGLNKMDICLLGSPKKLWWNHVKSIHLVHWSSTSKCDEKKLSMVWPLTPRPFRMLHHLTIRQSPSPHWLLQDHHPPQSPPKKPTHQWFPEFPVSEELVEVQQFLRNIQQEIPRCRRATWKSLLRKLSM